MSVRLYRQRVPQSASRGLQRSRTLPPGKDVLAVTSIPIWPTHIPAFVVSRLTCTGPGCLAHYNLLFS